MKASDLGKMVDHLGPTDKMPVLFIGHGSPMNAIEENEFVDGFRRVGETLPKPHAIICISAHWQTRGTMVTAMPQPRTIHDFGGFPRALYEVEYPAPGDPELAAETQRIISGTTVGLDYEWGLDHGSWSVLRHLYPQAGVPIIEMSLDYSQPASWHYDLARELAALRKKGVLIIGSGNMVHNLRMVAWDKMEVPGYAFEWAAEAGEKMKRSILDGDHSSLIQWQSQGRAFNLAIPTPEHYLPLLYALALQDKDDSVSLFNDKYVAGSLSMTSLKIAGAR
jgi:4,5-DOPA dioxygenase extradiol